MSSLSNIKSAEVAKLLGDRCMVKATLAINAGSAATIKSTGTIVYSIGGVMYSHAALSAQAITITHGCFGDLVANYPAKYTQPVGTTVFYLVCLDASGNVAVVQGNYAGQSLTNPNDLSKVLTGAGGLPVEPAGYTAIGVIKIALANAATFNPATTALDATDVTATYYDVSVLPASL
jgi:hypothetical protein